MIIKGDNTTLYSNNYKNNDLLLGVTIDTIDNLELKNEFFSGQGYNIQTTSDDPINHRITVTDTPDLENRNWTWL